MALNFGLLGGGYDADAALEKQRQMYQAGLTQRGRNLRQSIIEQAQVDPNLDIGQMADFQTYMALDPEGASDIANTISALRGRNLRQSIIEQVQANPNSDIGQISDFQTYMGLDPTGAANMMGTFEDLSDERKKRYISAQLGAKVALENGDVDGALLQLENHISKVKQDNGDTRNSEYVYNMIKNGNPMEALKGLQQMEEALVQQGLILEDPSFTDKREKAREAAKAAVNKRVQSTNYEDGGSMVTYTDGTQQWLPYSDQMANDIKRYQRKWKPELMAAQIAEILDTQNAAENSRAMASTAERISKQYGKMDPLAGLPAKGTELWKTIWGYENEISALRKDYTRITNEFLVNGLPPGIASDRDVALIRAGYLEATANAGQLAEFMGALSRTQRDAAIYDEFKAAFLERSGGIQVADRPFNYRNVSVQEGMSVEDAFTQYMAQRYPQKYAAWLAKRNGGINPTGDAPPELPDDPLNLLGGNQ